MNKAYRLGTHILGAEAAQSLEVQFQDAGAAVRSQGGSTGKILFDWLPQTTEDLAYDQLADEIVQKAKERGVILNVKKVRSVGTPRGTSEFGKGVVVGAVGSGLLYGIYRIARSFF